jgi:hypothetical protein
MLMTATKDSSPPVKVLLGKARQKDLTERRQSFSALIFNNTNQWRPSHENKVIEHSNDYNVPAYFSDIDARSAQYCSRRAGGIANQSGKLQSQQEDSDQFGTNETIF